MRTVISGERFVPERGKSRDQNVIHFYRIINLLHKDVVNFLARSNHFNERLDSRVCEGVEILDDARRRVILPRRIVGEINFLKSATIVYNCDWPAVSRRIELLDSWPYLVNKYNNLANKRIDKWESMWFEEFYNSSVPWGATEMSAHELPVHHRVQERAHAMWAANMIAKYSRVAIANPALVSSILVSGFASNSARDEAERQIDSLLRSEPKKQNPSNVNLDQRDAWGNFEDDWKNTKPR